MKLFVVLFALMISTSLFAQIGGLSSSKIGAQTVSVVDHKSIEFEPGFFHARSSQCWDNSGTLNDSYCTSDSVNAVTGMYFRFTYGLWDKLEIGVAITTDLAISQWGLRYAFLQKEKYGLALIAGVNIPFGNRTIDQRVHATRNLIQGGLGLVGSYQITDNFSWDITTQYLRFFEETEDHDIGGVYLYTDLGYYVFNGQLQLVFGGAFHSFSNDLGNHQLLTLYPGITVETGKNYGLAFSVPFDVYGKRASKALGFNFALTLTFN